MSRGDQSGELNVIINMLIYENGNGGFFFSN